MRDLVRAQATARNALSKARHSVPVSSCAQLDQTHPLARVGRRALGPARQERKNFQDVQPAIRQVILTLPRAVASGASLRCSP